VVLYSSHSFDTIQQCDGQTDALAMAKTREAFCCRS